MIDNIANSNRFLCCLLFFFNKSLFTFCM